MSRSLHAIATVRHRLRTQRRHEPSLVARLRLIASQHQVCYEIWPRSSTAGRKPTQEEFDLLLCGVNGHATHDGNGLHAVSCCTHCARTYHELREIAEWIMDLTKPPSGFEIYPFDHAPHMAPPHRHHRSEIIVITTIFHSAEKPGDYGCESECLKEIRERLSKLGIREDVLYAPV